MSDTEEDMPKLPVQQLTILAIARFAEPLAMTSIYPYLPEMVLSFGVPRHAVARWAGITSAAFSIAQSMTAVPWGKASDKYGRKPTIIVGLFSTMMLFLVWGVSTSLPMAITVRVLLGSGNGNVGIIRTMVAEMITDKRLQPRAFSIMPLVWSIGSVFGPAIGGLLAKPADRFPALFGGNTFLENYPFALPNIVMAIFFLISMSTALFFLKETLETRRHQKDWGLQVGKRITRPFRKRASSSRLRRASFMDGEATAPLLAPRGQALKNSRAGKQHSMKEVFTAQTSIGLVAYTFLALHSVAFDQVLPVFLNTPQREQTPENSHLPFQFTGGFGIGSERIGTLFAIYGITCGVVQFTIFPPMCKRIGVLNCFRLCAYTCPLVYFLTPFTILFPTEATRYAALLVLMLYKAFAVIIGFPCMTILLTNSASNLQILGTLNGFATMFSGLGRAFGPAFAGIAFSWGEENGYGITAWWLLGMTGIIGAIPCYFLTEGEGPSSHSDDEEEEDDLEEEDDDDEEDEDAVASDSEIGGAGASGSNGQNGKLGEHAPLLGRRAQNGSPGQNGYNSMGEART